MRFSRRVFLATGARVAMALGATALLPRRLAMGAPDSARASTVSVVSTQSRNTGVREAVALLGLAQAFFAGRTVVLKPNFNSADPYPGSTHADTLAALVTLLREMGAGAITVADRSGMGDTRQVMEAKGVFDLGRRLGFEVVPLDELPAPEWEPVPLRGSHWARGVEVPRLITRAQRVVGTCCLKTHRFGGHFSLSLKNAVGMVARRSARDGYDYMRELHASPAQREMIAEINAAYVPDLFVLDALEGFARGGPDRGTLVRPGVILAATDRVALDAAGVAILRMYDTTPEVAQGRIFDLPQIRRAADLGLGARAASEVRLAAAPDPESQAFAARVRDVLAGG